MIKAVIFDCFGVLTSEGWQEFKETHFSDEKKLAEANRLNYLADQGKLNHEELLPMIAELASLTVEQARKEIDNYVPNKKLLDYIDNKLSGKYKIGMLSNVSDDWLEQIFVPGQLESFDAFALSYKIGIAKPDKRAFEKIAELLDVGLEECVFLDDSKFFADEATKYGMQGINYINFDDSILELERILEMSNTDK